MKRVLATVLVVCVIASLALCGCQSGNNPGGGKSGKNLTIATFVDLHIDEPGTDEAPNVFYLAKKKYEEETGGKVTVKLYNAEQFTSKLVTLIGSGNSPDLIYCGSGSTPKYQAMELLQPIDDLVDLQTVNYPDAAESFVWKNKHYALRVEQIQPYMIWYNKKLFEKNGTEDPYTLWKNGEWTWDKFKELGTELTQDTDSDGTIDQWGFSTAGVFTPMWANGGKWWKADENGKVSVSWKDDAFYNGLKFMQEAAGTWWTTNPGDGYNTFAAGGCAMVGYTFEFIWQSARDMDTEDIGCVPWPTGPNFEENGGFYQTYCNLIGLAQGAKNAEGAILYTQMMTQIEKDINGKYLPFGNASAEKYFTDEHWEALDYARSKSKIDCSGWGDWASTRWFFPIYSDGADIVATLDSLQPVLEAEIQKTLAYKLPEVKEFKTPQKVTFENDNLSYWTTAGCVADAAKTTSEQPIDGQTSMVLNGSESGQLLMRTDKSQLELPTYWTYRIQFDWKVLAEAEPGMGTDFYLAIRQDNALDAADVQIGYLAFGGTVGESGQVNNVISLSQQVDASSLVIVSGNYCGTIMIDNFEITAE